MQPNIKTYAGIGSRKAPPEAIALMRRIGAFLALEGYSLNSGGANGSDKAFEAGARLAVPFSTFLNDSVSTELINIYLPWHGFNDYKPSEEGVRLIERRESVSLVEDHHPGFKNLSESTMKLMRRNCHQVLGRDLRSPVKFVLCWTADKAITGDMTTPKTGGTGFAIRLASHYKIPVFNLALEEHAIRIQSWVNKLEAEWHDKGLDFNFNKAHEEHCA